MDIKNKIDEIFTQQKVYAPDGSSFPLDSNVDREEGALLENIIRENAFSKTIEIGCAYGISSLFICSGLKGQNQPKHYIIDPYQTGHWKGIGEYHLKQSQVDYYTLIKKPSELALPELLKEGHKFDFALIDGWHTLDHTLIDFFYLNRMIRVGGIIVIDDVGMPSIRKLMRYIVQYPAYTVETGIALSLSAKRTSYNKFIKKPLRRLTRIFPKKVQEDLFNPELLKSDYHLGLNMSLLVLRKVQEDDRPWNWFATF